jgi:hypothetical protein
LWYARRVQRARTRLVGFIANPRFHAALCLAIGFAGLLVYAFPGYMSSDSLVQLLDGRAHKYTDWHPPAMAAVWGVLDRIVKGPALMLLLQGSLFLIGSYRILRHVLCERGAAIAASAILLFPPVLAPMAVIWKDSQMAGLLLMAISLLLDPRKRTQVIGVVLLTIATAFRDNGAAATLPVLVLLFRWPTWRRRWTSAALACVLWVATIGAALTTNKLLTDTRQYPWYVSLGPADVIGVLKQSRPYSDEELLKIFEGTPLVQTTNIQQHCRTYYSPSSWWYYMSGPRRVFNWPVIPEHRTAIARAWRTMVFDNPGAYLLHRLRVFRLLISINHQDVMDPAWHTHVDQAKRAQPGEFYDATGVQASIGDALIWLARHTSLFRPYLYLLLSLLFLPFAWRHRDVLALLASGISYELGLFFVAPSPDFRYSHWMVTCAILATVILVARRVKQAHSDAHAHAAAGEPAG